MKRFANLITSVLHPVTLTIPGVFLIVYDQTKSFEISAYWTFLSLLFTGIISAFVFLGVKKGFFNNLDVSNRKQRIILYPAVIVVILLFALFVFWQRGPIGLTYGSIFFVMALVILDIINTKIKASIHVAAVSAIVTGLIFQYGGISYLLLLLIPLIAWARILEKRHTLTETIVGAASGIALTYISLLVVQFML